jgi:branched-chain amino acid transport system substrate-binding protein
MAFQDPRVPRVAAGLVALLALLVGCTPKVTAPPEPPNSLRRGDDAFRYGDYEAAIKNYRTYLDEVPADAYTARGLYKVALSQYRLHHYENTLATLDEFTRRYPKGHWAQVDALRGDTYRKLDRPVEAISCWDKAWTVASPGDRRKLRQRIVALSHDLDDRTLAQAQRTVMNAEVRGLLEEQIAARSPGLEGGIPDNGDVSAGAHVAAKPGKATVERPFAGTPAPPKAAAPPAPPPPVVHVEPLPPADARVHGTAKVACLLPLSGPSQDIGARSLRGLQLLFGANSKHLTVVDSGGDTAAAVQAFAQVSQDPDVVAVVGPLRGEDAEAIAPLARQAELPLLLLSQRDGLAGGSVLQAGMTRGGLVTAVTDYAMQRVRMRQFGVLYPADDTGQQYLASFRSEVTQRGGTIVGADGYEPRAPQLPAITLKRWRKDLHLQAIFLPDDVDAARSVAHFVERDMPDVTLLGVGDWESLAGDGSAMNGVLFADGFFSGSTRPGTQQFVARFQQMYGTAPGTVEAQAYDAGLLVLTALEAGAQSRAAVLQTLQTHAPIEGATGQLAVSSTGLDRRLFLLQVSDGKVQEVSSAN